VRLFCNLFIERPSNFFVLFLVDFVVASIMFAGCCHREVTAFITPCCRSICVHWGLCSMRIIFLKGQLLGLEGGSHGSTRT